MSEPFSFIFFFSFLSLILLLLSFIIKKTHRALDLDRRHAPAGLEDGLELSLGGAGAVDGAVGVGGRRGEGLLKVREKERERERKEREKKRREREREECEVSGKKREKTTKAISQPTTKNSHSNDPNRAASLLMRAPFWSRGEPSSALHSNTPRSTGERARKGLAEGARRKGMIEDASSSL